jgi:hypothetical protein
VAVRGVGVHVVVIDGAAAGDAVAFENGSVLAHARDLEAAADAWTSSALEKTTEDAVAGVTGLRDALVTVEWAAELANKDFVTPGKTVDSFALLLVAAGVAVRVALDPEEVGLGMEGLAVQAGADEKRGDCSCCVVLAALEFVPNLYPLFRVDLLWRASDPTSWSAALGTTIAEDPSLEARRQVDEDPTKGDSSHSFLRVRSRYSFCHRSRGMEKDLFSTRVAVHCGCRDE